MVLDANTPRLWKNQSQLPKESKPSPSNLNFVLSDDQPLEAMEGENVLFRSLGEQWLQGHMAIGIVHFLLDEGVELNL